MKTTRLILQLSKKKKNVERKVPLSFGRFCYGECVVFLTHGRDSLVCLS